MIGYLGKLIVFIFFIEMIKILTVPNSHDEGSLVVELTIDII